MLKIPIIICYDSDENNRFILYSSNETGIPQLYLTSTKINSKPRQITNGQDPVINGYISPKGDKITYLKDKAGDEIFNLFLFVEEAEDKQITKNPYRTMGIGWHPNGKEMVRSYFSMRGTGLEIINVETEESFILKHPTPLLIDIQYSPGGKWIACTNITNYLSTEVYIINRDNPSEIITYSLDNETRDAQPSWSQDGKKLAFISEVKGKGQVVIQEFQGQDRIILDLEQDEEVLAIGDGTTFPPRGGNVIWDPKGDKIFCIINKEGRTTLHGYPINGKMESNLPFPKGFLRLPKISKDGKNLIALHCSMTSPSGIYLLKLGFESVLSITPRNFSSDMSLLNQPQSKFYKSFDEKEIHAWYIPSITNKAYNPAVMYVHGGPWSHIKDCWISGIFMQILSQSGFCVFAPNFRGSTGYGVDFQKMNIKDPGGGDLQDLISGAKWLKSQAEIDSSKLGIMGASYGGFMTLCALTRFPDAFSVGVSLVPVTDWLELYRVSDGWAKHACHTLFTGPPRGKLKQLYIERSPITHILNIKSNIMIMAGKKDSRAAYQPIEKFIAKLKEMNHPHEVILDENAGHISALFNWDESIPFFTEIIEFLKKNL